VQRGHEADLVEPVTQSDPDEAGEVRERRRDGDDACDGVQQAVVDRALERDAHEDRDHAALEHGQQERHEERGGELEPVVLPGHRRDA
jgi:hypothetical protein